MQKAKLEKSAGAVVFRQEDSQIYYLLLHHEAGHWGFPKGLIEKGETLQETAKREIKEETGIENVKFIHGFKEHIKYFYKFEGKLVFKIVTFLLAETKQKQIKISFEHIGWQWLTFEEALQQLSFQNDKEVLQKARKIIELNVLTQKS